MMRILFCNIAWMNYYKGNKDGKDEPKGGGDYVVKNKDAHEKYNFTPDLFVFDDEPEAEAKEYCLGFVETKATNGNRVNQLHIEKIDGCQLCSKEKSVEDVLVVYCATHPTYNFTTVVGWYKHATVYREYQPAEFKDEDGELIYTQYYNAIAKKEDCVLLPTSARSKIKTWGVPRKRNGASYGFGRANVWFAAGAEENSYLKEFLQRLHKQIEEYDGENWLEEGYGC